MSTERAASVSPSGEQPPKHHVNATDYLLEAGRPDDVAIVHGERSYTYRELRAAVDRLAAELAGLGLPPGSRVGIMAANSFFWVAAYLASMKANVAVPYSDKSGPEEVRRQATWVGCTAVFMDQHHRRRYEDAFDGMLIITEDALAGTDETGWPESGTAGPDAVDPDADAVLMFTSGTTSGPKAVRLTHRNLLANTESIITYLELRRDDRMLVILPFFYCYGASLMHTHLRAGGSIVLCNQFVFPELAIDMMEREQCTGFAGVPSSFQLLLRASNFASRALPSLRLIQQAGGRLPPVMVEELVAAQPGAQLFVMYGQTEATARLSYLPPDLRSAKIGSIGRGIPGVRLRVLDEDGRPVAVGETGEIVAYGDNISPGYYNDPDESATKFHDGGLWTGDLAVVDEDGYIFIVDRKADFIKSWGHRVSSLEIEACVLQMKDLVSAAAIGVPDPEAGEAIALAATVRPGATVSADDVLAFVRRNLAKHMVPRSVHLIEAMPMTASGKIAKTELRTVIGAALQAH
jgi:acyl-CoA synthetase (AMP-forming)/AMP-acid ligase II